ncbi:hypothetical protein HDU82_002669 [Entophlyctis luteolus]|nr:hypothetical protein HDU82_002669 [Entophlyctis luteolus]
MPLAAVSPAAAAAAAAGAPPAAAPPSPPALSTSRTSSRSSTRRSMSTAAPLPPAPEPRGHAHWHTRSRPPKPARPVAAQSPAVSAPAAPRRPSSSKKRSSLANDPPPPSSTSSLKRPSDSRRSSQKLDPPVSSFATSPTSPPLAGNNGDGVDLRPSALPTSKPADVAQPESLLEALTTGNIRLLRDVVNLPTVKSEQLYAAVEVAVNGNMHSDLLRPLLQSPHLKFDPKELIRLARVAIRSLNISNARIILAAGPFGLIFDALGLEHIVLVSGGSPSSAGVATLEYLLSKNFARIVGDPLAQITQKPGEDEIWNTSIGLCFPSRLKVNKLSKKDCLGLSLARAVTAGNMGCIKVLLDYGVDAKWRNRVCIRLAKDALHGKEEVVAIIEGAINGTNYGKWFKSLRDSVSGSSSALDKLGKEPHQTPKVTASASDTSYRQANTLERGKKPSSASAEKSVVRRASTMDWIGKTRDRPLLTLVRHKASTPKLEQPTSAIPSPSMSAPTIISNRRGSGPSSAPVVVDNTIIVPSADIFEWTEARSSASTMETAKAKSATGGYESAQIHSEASENGIEPGSSSVRPPLFAEVERNDSHSSEIVSAVDDESSLSSAVFATPAGVSEANLLRTENSGATGNVQAVLSHAKSSEDCDTSKYVSIIATGHSFSSSFAASSSSDHRSVAPDLVRVATATPDSMLSTATDPSLVSPLFLKGQLSSPSQRIFPSVLWPSLKKKNSLTLMSLPDTVLSRVIMYLTNTDIRNFTAANHRLSILCTTLDFMASYILWSLGPYKSLESILRKTPEPADDRATLLTALVEKIPRTSFAEIVERAIEEDDAEFVARTIAALNLPLQALAKVLVRSVQIGSISCIESVIAGVKIRAAVEVDNAIRRRRRSSVQKEQAEPMKLIQDAIADTCGGSALDAAASRGDLQIVIRLLQAGADPTVDDSRALRVLCARSAGDAAAIAKHFLDAGAEVSAKGFESFLLACVAGNEGLLQVLLAKILERDPPVLDHDEQALIESAFMILARQGHSDCVKHLLSVPKTHNYPLAIKRAVCPAVLEAVKQGWVKTVRVFAESKCWLQVVKELGGEILLDRAAGYQNADSDDEDAGVRERKMKECPIVEVDGDCVIPHSAAMVEAMIAGVAGTTGARFTAFETTVMKKGIDCHSFLMCAKPNERDAKIHQIKDDILLLAVWLGHETVMDAVVSILQPHVNGPEGLNALIAATCLGHTKIVASLISAGVDFEGCDGMVFDIAKDRGHVDTLKHLTMMRGIREKAAKEAEKRAQEKLLKKKASSLRHVENDK